MELRNLFADLGLGIDATAADVHAAYRRLAMEHHPDRNPDEPEAAHERMVEVNTAYDLLSIDEVRAAHRCFLDALVKQLNANRPARPALGARNGLGAVLTEDGWLMPDARTK